MSDREAATALGRVFTTWKRVVTDPHAFLADMPETGGLGEPLSFLAVCAGANAVGSLLVGASLQRALCLFLLGMAVAVVFAAALVVVAQGLFGGRAGFEPTFRVVAWAWAPLVLGWLPLVGAAAWLYHLYIVLRGTERVQQLDTTRAVLSLLVVGAVLAALFVVHPLGPRP